MKMTPLILLILGVSGVYCDSHSLRYYTTAVTIPGSGLPVYSEVVYVDDRQIVNYNSDTRLHLPKTEWMKKLGSDYWERETQRNQAQEADSKHNLKAVMSRFNQTGGFHIYQWMFGCELGDDGTIDGYDLDGYDGRDFIYLDTQRGMHMPAMDEALLTTQRWDSPEFNEGERMKIYLENECLEWLKKFFEYGREDLEKRVRPEVKVWGHPQSHGVTRLQCLVYGFHPQDVHVKWVRNGVDDVPSDEMSPILPHPDGTYQIRVSAEVPVKDGDTYSCHVDHSSLEQILRVKWEPDNGPSMALIIGIVCAGVAVIALAGVCVYFYKKWGHDYTATRKLGRDYTATRTSDNNSDSSSNPQPENT